VQSMARVVPPAMVAFAMLGEHSCLVLTAGELMVTESAEGTALVVVQAPLQASGRLSGTPAPVPGQLPVLAVIVGGWKHAPEDGLHEQGGEQEVTFGGVSR
jgi:hypothetical protein